MHISQVVLKPLEEFFARSGRPLSAYFESQHRFYEPHYARLLVNLLIHDLSKELLLKSIISYNCLNL